MVLLFRLRRKDRKGWRTVTRIDRAGELIEGIGRGRKELISPEGVPLDVRIAGHGERLAALIVDWFLMWLAIIGLILIFFLFLAAFPRGESAAGAVWYTLIMFMFFIVRNLYFLHFELAWQGRTPGKKICGLRVINRNGGELSPSAIIARNITREVEIFLPFGLFLSLDASHPAWGQLAALGWVLALTSVPFFNSEHLRAGDLIAGTQVIAMPKRALLSDLTEQPRWVSAAHIKSVENVKNVKNYAFTHEQLAIYGNLELQVLEEILRRPVNASNDLLLVEVCGKICRKIGWKEPVPPENSRSFLNDFYAAERADLERGQLFGRVRADKNATLE